MFSICAIANRLQLQLNSEVLVGIEALNKIRDQSVVVTAHSREAAPPTLIGSARQVCFFKFQVWIFASSGQIAEQAVTGLEQRQESVSQALLGWTPPEATVDCFFVASETPDQTEGFPLAVVVDTYQTQGYLDVSDA